MNLDAAASDDYLPLNAEQKDHLYSRIKVCIRSSYRVYCQLINSDDICRYVQFVMNVLSDKNCAETLNSDFVEHDHIDVKDSSSTTTVANCETINDSDSVENEVNVIVILDDENDVPSLAANSKDAICGVSRHVKVQKLCNVDARKEITPVSAHCSVQNNVLSAMTDTHGSPWVSEREKAIKNDFLKYVFASQKEAPQTFQTSSNSRSFTDSVDSRTVDEQSIVQSPETEIPFEIKLENEEIGDVESFIDQKEQTISEDEYATADDSKSITSTSTRLTDKQMSAPVVPLQPVAPNWPTAPLQPMVQLRPITSVKPIIPFHPIVSSRPRLVFLPSDSLRPILSSPFTSPSQVASVPTFHSLSTIPLQPIARSSILNDELNADVTNSVNVSSAAVQCEVNNDVIEDSDMIVFSKSNGSELLKHNRVPSKMILSSQRAHSQLTTPFQHLSDLCSGSQESTLTELRTNKSTNYETIGIDDPNPTLEIKIENIATEDETLESHIEPEQYYVLINEPTSNPMLNEVPPIQLLNEADTRVLYLDEINRSGVSHCDKRVGRPKKKCGETVNSAVTVESIGTNTKVVAESNPRTYSRRGKPNKSNILQPTVPAQPIFPFQPTASPQCTKVTFNITVPTAVPAMPPFSSLPTVPVLPFGQSSAQKELSTQPQNGSFDKYVANTANVASEVNNRNIPKVTDNMNSTVSSSVTNPSLSPSNIILHARKESALPLQQFSDLCPKSPKSILPELRNNKRNDGNVEIDNLITFSGIKVENVEIEDEGLENRTECEATIASTNDPGSILLKDVCPNSHVMESDILADQLQTNADSPDELCEIKCEYEEPDELIDSTSTSVSTPSSCENDTMPLVPYPRVHTRHPIFSSSRRYTSVQPTIPSVPVPCASSLFVCNLCKKEFKSEENLNRHMQFNHGTIVFCRRCRKSFLTQKSLADHVRVCNFRRNSNRFSVDATDDEIPNTQKTSNRGKNKTKQSSDTSSVKDAEDINISPKKRSCFPLPVDIYATKTYSRVRETPILSFSAQETNQCSTSPTNVQAKDSVDAAKEIANSTSGNSISTLNNSRGELQLENTPLVSSAIVSISEKDDSSKAVNKNEKRKRFHSNILEANRKCQEAFATSPPTCSCCQFSLIRPKNRRIHAASKCPGKSVRTCSLCTATIKCHWRFTSSTDHNFEEHFHVVHNSSYWRVCPICRKCCVSKERLNKHMDIIHKKNPFRCDRCSFVTNRELALKYHEASWHKKRNSFKCKSCGRQLKDFATLIGHRRIHCDRKRHAYSLDKN